MQDQRRVSELGCSIVEASWVDRGVSNALCTANSIISNAIKARQISALSQQGQVLTVSQRNVEKKVIIIHILEGVTS